MINKILFLIESPFNKRDFKRFGVEVFIENGFEVYVWDFTPFLHPKFNTLITQSDPIEYENLIRFDSKRDAIAAIGKKGGDSFIISLIGYHDVTYSIFRQISKNKIPYSVFAANTVPYENINKSKNISFWEIVCLFPMKIIRLTPKKAINHFLFRMPLALLGINAATFALAGGAKRGTNMPLINHETEVLWIHSLDYDIYLDYKEGGHCETNIAVFVDQYLPFHSDFIHSGVKNHIVPEEYYSLLCKFFDYMEEKYNLNVVIAAHPRSHYEKLPDYFQGRNVIRGKAFKLVKDAKLVIMHWSAAINFAVLYKKPVIFITTDILEKDVFGKYISKFASYFRKTPINISKNVSVDLEKELFVYEEGYAKYKNDFIKVEGTEEIPFWQVVSNKIKSLNVGS